MNQIAEDLSAYLVKRLEETSPTARLLFGIAGVPASGKSTLAQLIVDRVNAATCGATVAGEASIKNDIAVLIGLDGWHLTRAQLDTFPDSKLAHDRRGAHWTFDGDAYVGFVCALRKPHDPSAAKSSSVSNVIYAPSFSHTVKDPEPLSVPIYPHHRLVVIEGLYTFLGIPPWLTAAELLDERWWVEVGDEEAEKRLVARHVRSGVAKDLSEAMWRSRENDAPSEYSVVLDSVLS
ncbi:hypothetical protein A0H81_00269 [Grifola frondosa]|uniref:Uridine kinase C227.14 n=1 Tax=Grifola frondosa TaxID=5627 RepID=A0A1C7MRT9_GRIFR|nr:hypothetical protein A0H81_00269 [Grifola frondosa]